MSLTGHCWRGCLPAEAQEKLGIAAGQRHWGKSTFRVAQTFRDTDLKRHAQAALSGRIVPIKLALAMTHSHKGI